MPQQSDFEKLLLRARLQIEEGQHQLAILYLERMHSDNPKQQREKDYLLGWCYVLSRHWQEAREALDRVTNEPDPTNEVEEGGILDRERRALCYHRLGKVALQLQRYEDAARHYNKSLKLFQHPKIARPLEEVECTYGIGTSYLVRGHYSAAIHWYRLAWEQCASLENEQHLARIFHCLCQAYRFSKKLSEAKEFGERALYLYVKRKDYELEGRIHNELGHIALEYGDYRKASDHFTDALAIAINYHSPKMIMVNNTALALLRMREKRFEDARRCCQRAQEASVNVTDAGLLGWTYLTFGQVAQNEAKEQDGTHQRDLLEEAVEWFQKAEKQFSVTQDYEGIAELSKDWGNALEALGQTKAAISRWKQGYEALSSATGPLLD